MEIVFDEHRVFLDVCEWQSNRCDESQNVTGIELVDFDVEGRFAKDELEG